jgi:hypothetical protein
MSPSALRADCASLAAGIESVASGAALTRVDVDGDGVCVALTMEPRRAVTVIFEARAGRGRPPPPPRAPSSPRLSLLARAPPLTLARCDRAATTAAIAALAAAPPPR